MFSKEQVNYCLDPEIISFTKQLTNPEKIEFFLKSAPFKNFTSKFKTPYLSTMYSHFGVKSGTIRGRRSFRKIENKKKLTSNIKNEEVDNVITTKSKNYNENESKQ